MIWRGGTARRLSQNSHLWLVLHMLWTTSFLLKTHPSRGSPASRKYRPLANRATLARTTISSYPDRRELVNRTF